MPEAKPATLPVSDDREPAKPAPKPLSLQRLQYLLEMPITETLLRAIGFHRPLTVDDFPAICDALIAHITTKKGA